MTATTVVKIGGSLTESDAAATFLCRLSTRRPPGLILVPGGGNFAETVRFAQQRHAFSDHTAHHMALIAMHISAVMLAAFAPGLLLAETPEEFESAWQRDLTPLWAPERMVLAASDIPASWEVTSDSLAAWLAAQVGAARLVLVKACPIAKGAAGDAQALAAAGVVDRAFPRFVGAGRFAWRVVSDLDSALAAIGAGDQPGSGPGPSVRCATEPAAKAASGTVASSTTRTSS